METQRVRWELEEILFTQKIAKVRWMKVTQREIRIYWLRRSLGHLIRGSDVEGSSWEVSKGKSKSVELHEGYH